MLIRMKYSTSNLNTTSHIYLTALYANITPITWSPTKHLFFVSRILDGGAHGVIVPYIRSSQDARDAVNAAKYQPLGHCSAMSGLPLLQSRPLPSSIASPAINAATMVIPMIETLQAVKGAEAIAAVPGVDFLLIRTNDLKAETGIPGQYDALRVHHAYRRLLDACGQHGV
jgi:4-hydroxy-2-oxoheptanedioate aldolase